MSCLCCPRILNWMCQWLTLEPSTKALALPHPAGAWLLSKGYNFAVIRRWGRAVFWQMLCKQYRRTINPDLWLQEVTFCFLTKKTILYSKLNITTLDLFPFFKHIFSVFRSPWGGSYCTFMLQLKQKWHCSPPKKITPLAIFTNTLYSCFFF